MRRIVTVFETFEKKAVAYVGVFHGFYQDHMEYESGPGPFPVALVEKADGSVESVYAGNIQFGRSESSKGGE